MVLKLQYFRQVSGNTCSGIHLKAEFESAKISIELIFLRGYAGCGNISNILKNVNKYYLKNIKYSLLYITYPKIIVQNHV